METTLQNAYKEIGQILNLLGNEYKAKIPPKVLTLFEQNETLEYGEIDDWYNRIENGQISRNALVILSILNIKYWANEEEKQQLQAIYDENEKEYQDKVNSYKTQDWLKREEKKEKLEEVSLVKVKEKSIWTKIKMFLKSLMSKRK